MSSTTRPHYSYFVYCQTLKFILIAITVFIRDAGSKNVSAKTCLELNDGVQKFLVKHLMGKYDNFQPPEHQPTVNIEIHVQQITDLSASSSDFEVDIFFSEIWNDPRLEFKGHNLCKANFTLTPDFERMIWTPDICIWNAKLSATHKSPGVNKFIMLYEDGKIWRNHRIILRAPCQFNLRIYPFDSVQCNLLFQSNTYELKELSLKWLNSNPVTLMHDVLLTDYTFINYTLDKTSGNYPDGTWDQARITFYFKRRFVYHLLETYIPSTITVIVSWITFFMEAKFISARVTVAVTALLALSIQFGVNEELPRASQLKGADIWMLICVCFVFLTLVELALAARVVRWQRRKNLKNITITNFKNLIRGKYTPILKKLSDNFLLKKTKVGSMLSMPHFTDTMLDQYAIYLFPSLFAICNFCYWTYYLSVFHTFE